MTAPNRRSGPVDRRQRMQGGAEAAAYRGMGQRQRMTTVPYDRRAGDSDTPRVHVTAINGKPPGYYSITRALELATRPQLRRERAEYMERNLLPRGANAAADTKALTVWALQLLREQ